MMSAFSFSLAFLNHFAALDKDTLALIFMLVLGKGFLGYYSEADHEAAGIDRLVLFEC